MTLIAANKAAATEPSDRSEQATGSVGQRHKGTMLNPSAIFHLLLAFRLLNALMIRTFFQPDEYYQALEPAWNTAFGTGGLGWITWEWRQQLRSSLLPLIISSIYRSSDIVCRVLNLSPVLRSEVLLAAPKVLQAVLAACGDLYTWKLAQRIYGSNTAPAWTALLLTILNPWQWFCSTRTFSNCLETTLTVIALYNWPFSFEDIPIKKETSKSKTQGQKTGGKASSLGKPQQFARLEIAVCCGAIATILRPTNALIWICLTIYLFAPVRRKVTPNKDSQSKEPGNAPTEGTSTVWPSFDQVTSYLSALIQSGSVVLLISFLGDVIFYQKLTFPPYNFLVFNVFMGLAAFYGNNDTHYYLSQGYPLLLTTALPFMVEGIYNVYKRASSVSKLSRSSQDSLRGLALISLALPAAFSELSHKEVRFIYPVLPALHVISSLPISDFFGPAVTASYPASYKLKSTGRLIRRLLLLLMLSLNGLIAIYTTQIHNSGLIAVTDYLRHEFESRYLSDLPSVAVQDEPLTKAVNMTVAFLMPCHSVPWRSHLQYVPSSSQPGIAAWALTCEPPLHITDPTIKWAYEDEADIFYINPKAWIRENMVQDPPLILSGNPLIGYTYKPVPGVYADSSQKGHRNHDLWGKKSSRHWHSRDLKANQHQSLDITDLLPYLITTPSSSFSSLSLSSSSSTSFAKCKKLNLAPTSTHKITRPWPHYLIFFEQLEPMMTQILRGTGYRECHRQFNSHWHDDWRRKGDLVVLCLWEEEPRHLDIDIETEERGAAAIPELKSKPNTYQQQEEDKESKKREKKNKDRESTGQRMLARLAEEQNRME